MQHIMLRRIFKGLFIIILFYFSLSFIQAADSEVDYESTKNKVLNVQAVNPNLPVVSGQDQKGSIGYIISKMFDSNGKIGNWFLKLLGTRSDGAVLRWSGGSDGQFVTGSIYDNGTNVGIGTSSPNYKLDVSGDLNFTGDIRKNGTILNLAGKFQDGATAGKIYYNAGNVGIGTNAPISLLEVKATNNVTGVLTVGGGKSVVTTVGEINAQLDFRSNDASMNSPNQIGGRVASVTEYSNGAEAGLAFYTGKQGRTPILQEAMRINNNGNVGIGTNNPQHSLHLEKPGGPGIVWTNPTGTVGKKGMRLAFDNDRLTFQRTSDAGGFEANYLAIDQDTGNVGIGTVSPTTKLDVNGTIAFKGKGVIYGTANDVYMNARVLQNTSSTLTDGMYINYNSSNSLNNSVKFYTAGIVERMRINNDGNVGIGTTNPYHKLQVKGDVSIGQDDGSTPNNLYLYGSTAGKYSRLFTSNGNLHVDAGYGTGGDDEIYLNYYNGGNVHIGNPAKPSNLSIYGNTTTNLLTFKGVGGSSEQAENPYGIYQESGPWIHPYPDLVIGYHTGIKIGGHKSYNGTRFYNDAPGRAGSSVVMEVANGNDNVKVNHNLEVNGSIKTTCIGNCF